MLFSPLHSIVLVLTVVSSAAALDCSSPEANNVQTCTSRSEGSSGCVWCQPNESVEGGFELGFCISEVTAEFIRHKARCQRYVEAAEDDSSKRIENDVSVTTTVTVDDQMPQDDMNVLDDGSPTDDDKSSTDDKAPSDDKGAQSDDVVPDDFWKCLQKKTSKDCHSSNCTWCNTKASFGICMTGPAAESASKSDWFSCSNSTDYLESVPQSNDSNTIVYLRSQSTLMKVQDPNDPSCALAYLQNQTKEGCLAAVDADGNQCEFCSLQGAFSLCLTREQADFSEQIGVTCDSIQKISAVSKPKKVLDPLDTSCLLAYLQDQSKEGCLSAQDADGNPCEFCSLQGAFDICLTDEQAEYSEQLGITCNSTDAVRDPFDASCLFSFVQDQTQQGCVAAYDADGISCEFCTLPGGFSLCLNHEQAERSENLGVTCNNGVSETTIVETIDPYDTSCLLAYLQDQSKEACLAAQDADGNACEFCSLQGSFSLCLTQEQAQYSEQLGITCDEQRNELVLVEDNLTDPYDTSCLLAYLQDQSEDACLAAQDADGNACEFCSLQDSFSLCLTQEQAEYSEQLGLTCNSNNNTSVGLPSDFWTCLENYKDDDCRQTADCTWCNTQVGVGFCLAKSVAEATKECSFFDCEFGITPSTMKVEVS